MNEKMKKSIILLGAIAVALLMVSSATAVPTTSSETVMNKIEAFELPSEPASIIGIIIAIIGYIIALISAVMGNLLGTIIGIIIYFAGIIEAIVNPDQEAI